MVKQCTAYDGDYSSSGILPTVRPLPYFGAYPVCGERELAASLRADFLPLIARRLPDHHLVGQRHGSVPAFVARHKKGFPFFVRTDIANFYPSIRHQDVVVGVQLAWRDLLGLSYVPAKFKRRYVGGLMRWLESLPLERGLPLGSALSGVAAPLMLVPLWLEVKRRFSVPLTVYMDDVLICCRDNQQCAEVYALIANRLENDFDLVPNYAKTLSGRFAEKAVIFCGWRFAGGYAGIAPAKADAFRSRIDYICRRSRGCTPGAVIKRLNRQISAFGHYYKYGDVKKQFAELDVYIRRSMRGLDAAAVRTGGGKLCRLGLRALSDIRSELADRKRTRSVRPSGLKCQPVAQGKPVAAIAADPELIELLGAVSGKLTELVRGQRKLLRSLEHLLSGY